jgi:hypothetical protein
MTTKSKTRKRVKQPTRPAPDSPEAARARAILNARRAWGGLESAVQTDLIRLIATWREQDRLIEQINKNAIAALDAERTIGRAPGFQGLILPGRRRDVVVELQRRDRPTLIENPPLTQAVLVAPQPTPEAIAAIARGVERDRRNVARFNPAVTGVLPPGTAAL